MFEFILVSDSCSDRRIPQACPSRCSPPVLSGMLRYRGMYHTGIRERALHVTSEEPKSRCQPRSLHLSTWHGNGRLWLLPWVMRLTFSNCG